MTRDADGAFLHCSNEQFLIGYRHIFVGIYMHSQTDIEKIESLCLRINTASGWTKITNLSDLGKTIPQRTVFWHYSLPEHPDDAYALYMGFSPAIKHGSNERHELHPYFHQSAETNGLDHLLYLTPPDTSFEPPLILLSVKAETLDTLERKVELLESQNEFFDKLTRELLARSRPVHLEESGILRIAFLKFDHPGNG